jgi:hypothetical protein
MEFIPLNAVPLTGFSIETTTSTTTGETLTTTLVTNPDAKEKLAKAMEDMTLQGAEIRNLHEEIQNIQNLKSAFQARYNIEIHKAERLKQELQQLRKETIMAKTLSKAKENICMDICQSMTEIWHLIQIMFEQHELVQRARQAIDKIKGELGEMPTEVNTIIRFLNSK